ncbi:MAG: DUF2807 domain-containing protein [Rhizomicrobium sp.]
MRNRAGFLVLCGAGLALSALPACAGSNDWVTEPHKSFAVRSLQIDDLQGNLVIGVSDSGPVQLDISGVKWMVDRLVVTTQGGVLKIKDAPSNQVWDWRNWFNFHSDRADSKKLNVHLTVPRGMAVRVDDFHGSANIGDTYGPVNLGISGSGDARLGNVASAELQTAGGGKIQAGTVAGSLHAEIAGSGQIRTGNAGAVHAEIAGSGAVTVAEIATQLHVEIAGSGDFRSASVHGPAHIEISGSGSANIAGGVADPLHVEIMGSGDVNFGGVAVDPHLETMGSGRVHLKSYRGALRKEGHIDLKVGD